MRWGTARENRASVRMLAGLFDRTIPLLSVTIEAGAKPAGPWRPMCLSEYSNGGIVPTKLDELLRSAGDLTRLRILNLLREGRVCVCDLQQVLGLPQPTVSRHLAVLRHAGLVTDTRSGNRVLYSLAPAGSPQMKAFFEFLQECSRHDEIMKKDTRQLEEALRQGDCVVGEISNTTERVAT